MSDLRKTSEKDTYFVPLGTLVLAGVAFAMGAAQQGTSFLHLSAVLYAVIGSTTVIRFVVKWVIDKQYFRYCLMMMFLYAAGYWILWAMHYLGMALFSSHG